MRLLISWSIACALALPGPALGQAVPLTDLVGTWVWRRDGGEWFDSLKGQLVVTYLKVDPKGTFAYDGKIRKNDGEWHPWGIGWAKGSWFLAADTLRFTDDRNASVSYKVVLKDRQLFLWDWLMWDANRRDKQCAAKVFEHFDASTPLTLPPPPQITIQPADLAGTWAGTFETKQLGTVTDTLIIGADHTLTSVHYGKGHPWDPGDYFNTSSKWTLLPGDEFTGAGILGRYRIVLQNGELVPCSPIRAVLKRVSP